MGKKLEQTPVDGEPTPSLLTSVIANALSDEIEGRDVPFIDDITTAENVSNPEGYIRGAQDQALKNILDPEHEDYVPDGPERKLFLAETRGKTRKAVIARLEELTVLHASIAADRLEALQRVVLPAVRKGRQPAERDLIKALDGFQDLARGLSKSPPNIAYVGDLAASVKGLGVLLVNDPSKLGDYIPYLAVVANDQQRKKQFWTRGFKSLYGQYDFTGDPGRILAQFEDPDRIIGLLRLQRYFPKDLGKTAISS